MADNVAVRSKYVALLQSVAADVLLLATKLAKADTLYQGAGLSGTFVDAELLADVTQKHMVAADVGTFTSNLNTISTALTTNIKQNMAKAVGGQF